MRLSLLLVCGVIFSPLLALAGDIQVTCLKRGSQSTSGRARAGNIAKGSEEVTYTIALANNSSKQFGPLEIKYVVFVERQQIGEKKGTEVLQPNRGQGKLASLEARKKGEIITEPVMLKESTLQGSYIYTDGGRVKAKDSVKGVWIRVFDGDKMVADYANPATIATREKWPEGEIPAPTQ